MGGSARPRGLIVGMELMCYLWVDKGGCAGSDRWPSKRLGRQEVCEAGVHDTVFKFLAYVSMMREAGNGAARLQQWMLLICLVIDRLDKHAAHAKDVNLPVTQWVWSTATPSRWASLAGGSR